MTIVHSYDHPDTQRFLRWFRRQHMRSPECNTTCPICKDSGRVYIQGEEFACERCWYIRYQLRKRSQ